MLMMLMMMMMMTTMTTTTTTTTTMMMMMMMMMILMLLGMRLGDRIPREYLLFSAGTAGSGTLPKERNGRS
jgi:hypothetical protein